MIIIFWSKRSDWRTNKSVLSDGIFLRVSVWLFIRSGMDIIKLIPNSPNQTIDKYKKLKGRVLKCNANVYFNKQCLESDIDPYWKKIKKSKTSNISTYTTQKKVRRLRLKDETNYLHIKKCKMNTNLYHARIEATKWWEKLWYPNECHISKTLILKNQTGVS